MRGVDQSFVLRRIVPMQVADFHGTVAAKTRHVAVSDRGSAPEHTPL